MAALQQVEGRLQPLRGPAIETGGLLLLDDPPALHALLRRARKLAVGDSVLGVKQRNARGQVRPQSCSQTRFLRNSPP
jgi:hypothetical protein